MSGDAATSTNTIINTTDAQLGELLKFIRETAEKGVALASDQMPYLAQEIVAYTTYKHIMSIVFALPFVTISMVVVITLFNLARSWDAANIKLGKKQEETAGAIFMGCIVLIICSIFLIIRVSFIDIPGLVKCKTAPRLVVIDYIKGL